MLSIIIINPSGQRRQWGFEKIWKGLGEKKKLLTSYLQGIIGIHHPTVCPGGYNQEPSREKGEEAGDVLKKIPHLSKQLSGGAAWGAAGPWPTQVAGTLSASCASGIWWCKTTGLFLFLAPHCWCLELR